jgi:hypothetical protein
MLPRVFTQKAIRVDGTVFLFESTVSLAINRTLNQVAQAKNLNFLGTKY